MIKLNITKKVTLAVFTTVLALVANNTCARTIYDHRRPLRRDEAHLQFRSYREYKQALYNAVSRADNEQLKRLLRLYRKLQAQGLVDQGCMDLVKDISYHLRCRDDEECLELEDELLDTCLY